MLFLSMILVVSLLSWLLFHTSFVLSPYLSLFSFFPSIPLLYVLALLLTLPSSLLPSPSHNVNTLLPHLPSRTCSELLAAPALLEIAASISPEVNASNNTAHKAAQVHLLQPLLQSLSLLLSLFPLLFAVMAAVTVTVTVVLIATVTAIITLTVTVTLTFTFSVTATVIVSVQSFMLIYFLHFARFFLFFSSSSTFPSPRHCLHPYSSFSSLIHILFSYFLPPFFLSYLCFFLPFFLPCYLFLPSLLFSSLPSHRF